VIKRAVEEQPDIAPDAPRHLTLVTLTIAVALSDVADEIRELREAIEKAGP
jgi:hypothetical protein